MTGVRFDPAQALPQDWRSGTFVGRVESAAGPTPIVIRRGRAWDLSDEAPTVSALLERPQLWATAGHSLGPLESLGLRSAPDPGDLALCAPIDLQCVKAAGVTFSRSAVERVIEERARGDAAVATGFRARLESQIGTELTSVVPGSPEAIELKRALLEQGAWSPYLEVAIGPDAEIFTKAPVLAAVGWGAEIGVRSDSDWNNPEAEIVIVADSAGRAVGATLGNDVNLRDFEGRSALLLGKAKDNNASCALGPLIRLFDEHFGLEQLCEETLQLRVEGEDGFLLEESASMRGLSRHPTELLRQVTSEHQYPDGFVLFLGTPFAPVRDRDLPGRGFTHKQGDRVSVQCASLGTLVNRVTTCTAAPHWKFGIGALMANLAGRRLI